MEGIEKLQVTREMATKKRLWAYVTKRTTSEPVLTSRLA